MSESTSNNLPRDNSPKVDLAEKVAEQEKTLKNLAEDMRKNKAELRKFTTKLAKIVEDSKLSPQKKTAGKFSQLQPYIMLGIIGLIFGGITFFLYNQGSDTNRNQPAKAAPAASEQSACDLIHSSGSKSKDQSDSPDNNRKSTRQEQLNRLEQQVGEWN